MNQMFRQHSPPSLPVTGGTPWADVFSLSVNTLRLLYPLLEEHPGLTCSPSASTLSAFSTRYWRNTLG
ncbi:hypothetical protein ACOMHN_007810 [Nucella lapillus]